MDETTSQQLTMPFFFIAYDLGFGGGVVDNTNSDLPVPKVASSMSGLAAFIMWRSAYWTKQVSYTNKILSKFQS